MIYICLVLTKISRGGSSMRFNLRNLSSLTEGKDGKDYAYIGFPKGTIYEGYLVLIPFHLALPALTCDGKIDPWEYELKLPSSFVYHLSKTEIVIGQDNLPKPVVSRLQLTAQEMEIGYRKFTETHMMRTRMAIGTKHDVDEFTDYIEKNILINPPENDKEIIETLIYSIRKIDSFMFPQKTQSVNLSYLVELKNALESYNLKVVNKALVKMKSQINARTSYEMSYKFKDIDTSKHQYINQQIDDLTKAKERNDYHKIEKKGPKL